ncbi:MAG: thioredoxin family protein [Bdellovibrionota bacterium]
MEDVLLGEISRAQLASPRFAWFQSGYDAFLPHHERVIARLREVVTHEPIEVKMFLGTWCGDTREHLPVLLKILDLCGVPESHVSMIALGRDKHWRGLPEKFGVTRVPTFIFYRAHEELGRIVENPGVGLLEDLWEILGGDRT